MKMSKSYNILVLIAIFLMSMVLSVCSISFSSAKAETTLKASSYFAAGSNCTLSFNETENTLDAKLKEESSFSFRNEIVVDDFAMELSVSEGVNKIAVIFTSDCYSAIGTLDAEGKLMVDSKGNALKTYESKAEIDTSTDKNLTLTVSEIANSKNLQVKVNGNDLTVFDNVERVDKTTAKISIKLLDVEDTATEEQTISIKSVDQKASDATGNFKQEFAIENNKFKKEVLPRINLGDNGKNNIFIKDEYGNYDRLVMVQNKEQTFLMNAYSVLGNYNSKNVYVDGVSDGLWIANETTPKKLAFRNLGDDTFKLAIGKDGDKKILEEYSVEVIDRETDKDAPIYITTDANLITLYNKAIENIVYNEVEKGGAITLESIALGTEIDLPSLRDLVYDQYTPYNNLDFVLNYYTNANDKQTVNNDLGFKITKADNYLFYVIFKDDAGNEMEEEDFFKVDEDDANKINYGKYEELIFKFNVQDNATINIDTLEGVDGVGYVGVKYKAPAFKIEAEGCKTTYTLKYNKMANADRDDVGWIVIPKASTVTKKDYSDSYGNTYSSVQAIGYDGELTLTPNAAGSYMVEVTAVSDYTTRTDSAFSIVNISAKPKVVEVPNYWLRDNIWTVVFFSVGTLCLIGIIVLLCIKPKDETEVD